MGITLLSRLFQIYHVELNFPYYFVANIAHGSIDRLLKCRKRLLVVHWNKRHGTP